MKSLINLLLVCFLSMEVYAQQITLVKDIRTGTSSSNPEFFYKAADNKIYFFAINPVSSFRALYVTDGTDAGTKLLLDDVNTTYSYDNMYNENNFMAYNGNFCFWARVGNAQYYQLWFTNGTTQGTYALTNFTVSATIYSLTELNNQIYFIATFTSPDAIYKSNGQSGDATPIITLASDQRSSRLVKNNGKIYRIARFEIFELTSNSETLVYSDLNNCIGERIVVNNKLVFNKRACSTVDPIYKSTESFDFTTKSVSTISTTQNIGTNYNTTKNQLKVWNNKLYSITLPMKPITGPGSKTDVLYLKNTDGSSMQSLSVLYVDSNTIEFNGFREFNNKLYFAITLTPSSTPNPSHIMTRIYEVGSSSITKIFEFQDVTSNYKFKKHNYAILNDRVLFIADSNSFSVERTNLLISNGNTFTPVFASNNNNTSFEVTYLYALNSTSAILSSTITTTGNDIGKELYRFNLTTSGLATINKYHEINVYPNPSNDLIKIQLNSKINKVEVYDLNGCLVLVGEGAELNVEQLNTGLYLLKAITDEGVYSARFVRE